MDDLPTLGHLKFSHIIAHFESHVLQYISGYFHPLKNHLIAIWKALFPRSSGLARDAVKSDSTCEEIIQVIKMALLDQTLIEEAKMGTGGSVLGKRTRPGDLVIDETGWDPVKPSRMRTMQPKLSSKAPRQAKFMSKGSKAGGKRTGSTL
jgi:hypothetical protein